MCKSLNFSVKPKSIEYLESLVSFELLFHDVKQENLCSEDFSLMKARLRDTGLPSYESFSRDRSLYENLEKGIISDLKLLKDEEIIDKATYKDIKPVGSRPGVLYGLGKVHKETKNGLPHFRQFLLFSSLDKAENLKTYWFSKHTKINFSLEKKMIAV